MEQPKRGPRNRAEQRAIWRRKLREDLELEKETAEWLESDIELKLDSLFAEYDTGKRRKPAIQCRDTTINLLFTLMHRVAYFDGLLDGTGISKDAIRPSLYCEDV